MRFLVVSYDKEVSPVAYWDHAEAENGEAAMQYVEEIRDYAVAVDALTAVDLRRMAESLKVPIRKFRQEIKQNEKDILEEQLRYRCRSCPNIQQDGEDSPGLRDRYDGLCAECATKDGVSCAKCGEPISREAAILDSGTGVESGRTFFYCSEECRESH